MGQSSSCSTITYQVGPHQELHLKDTGSYYMTPKPRCMQDVCPTQYGTWKFEQDDTFGGAGLFLFKQPMTAFSSAIVGIPLHPATSVSQVWRIVSISGPVNGSTVLTAQFMGGFGMKPDEYPINVLKYGQLSQWVHKATQANSAVPLPPPRTG